MCEISFSLRVQINKHIKNKIDLLSNVIKIYLYGIWSSAGATSHDLGKFSNVIIKPTGFIFIGASSKARSRSKLGEKKRNVARMAD